MDLSGNVKIPAIGEVSKKTALIVGGGGLLIMTVLVYRSKKAKATAAAASAEINPATGYAYGSPEDTAALAAQGSTLPIQGGGTASTGTPSIPGLGFRSNAEWAQAAIAYIQSTGTVTDIGAFQTALGYYLNGQPAGAYQSLIEQAIAIEGYPPVSGANGYPPAINTNNPTAPTNNGDGSTGGTTTTVPPSAWVPSYTYVTVYEGNHVDALLAQAPGLTLAQLQALNPSVKIAYANGNGYISPTNPDRGGAIPVFNVGTSAQVKIPLT